MPEPITVKMRPAGRTRRSTTPFPLNGSEPPRLRNMSASMFVATATCGSIPTAIIVGTVMSDVLPVTTLMSAVRKKTTTSRMSFDGGTSK